MRLLLDECVPKLLIPHLAGYEVSTIKKQGWAGIKDGRLLSLMEATFDVFVSVDKSLDNQQEIPQYDIGVIVLRGKTNRIEHPTPLVEQLKAAIETIQSGEYIEISEQGN